MYYYLSIVATFKNNKQWMAKVRVQDRVSTCALCILCMCVCVLPEPAECAKRGVDPEKLLHGEVSGLPRTLDTKTHTGKQKFCYKCNKIFHLTGERNTQCPSLQDFLTFL